MSERDLFPFSGLLTGEAGILAKPFLTVERNVKAHWETHFSNSWLYLQYNDSTRENRSMPSYADVHKIIAPLAACLKNASA